jgi:RNA polymerase sigma-54 factor
MADISLHHALNQQQTLTPQMRRSLEILQSNSMELSQMIHQAMEMNPVLEQLDDYPDEGPVDEVDDRGLLGQFTQARGVGSGAGRQVHGRGVYGQP